MTNDAATRFEEALRHAFRDRYTPLGRLGAGAYGVVFRARDTVLERDVAVKQVRLDTITNPAQAEEMKRRTLREAKMAAKLLHPNIVMVHDVAHTLTSILIIMEFIDGTTLESRLREKGRLSRPETIELMSQTAAALDHAHARGVVHRDIKPANLMIDRSGAVKITDFGIAKSQSGTEMTANITATGNVLGTPYYMSPEQARGDVPLDGRSDLFSLGCVVYECLAGQKPFRGKAVVDILLRIVNGSADALDFDALSLHPDIGLVLDRVLAKEPEKRFESAREFVEALGNAPHHEAMAAGAAPVITSRGAGTSSFDINLQGELADKGLAQIIRDIQSERQDRDSSRTADGCCEAVVLSRR